ncbi:glycosyltransferase family 4 protein [Novosphingobium lentum]|uniref:glycosyltransferase family 4 protein n=1 Tax=Novosphingobium lentum TaxID=145287 RepID=UPI0008344704|nr:glycosyltransferase family 1 protein [Novosphingobium lentum]
MPTYDDDNSPGNAGAPGLGQAIAGLGDRLVDLSALMATVVAAAGGRAPETCLWIGRNDAFADALAAQLEQSRDGCAFFLGDASVDSHKTDIEAGYRFEGPAIAADEFPRLNDVVAFAQTRLDPAGVLGTFTASLDTARRSATRPVLDAIAEDFQLSAFDLVVIAGEPALTDCIVERAYGSKAILFDGTKETFGGAAAFARLYADTDYLLAASNDHEQGGWALFVQRDRSNSNLPVHFFTIVLNGEPFIRYHEQMLLDLECPWHWHVIEGVASLVKDTAWSVASGGHIPDSIHRRGKSNDGTTEYLDDLQRRYPNKVTVYRKPDDVFWDGKLEMVSAPIPHITEPCLLWQIDADELWTAAQVETVRRKFVEEPDRSAAWFWCNYFVGPDKGISTRLNYAQNPNQEWLRVWRFDPGMIWDKHEPPVLAGFDGRGESYDVGKRAPFTHREMEACGAVFDHFAYSTPEQAQFKESYYGYADAVTQWRALQAHDTGSGHLRDFFAWVTDDTMFDTVDRLGWTPLAHVENGTWAFRGPDELQALRDARSARRKPRILIDGVFFQLGSSGIARVWINLLKAWVMSGFADNVVLLDRGKTAPRIDGVIYRTIDAHSWDTVDGDARYLQEICDSEQADLFISTYYTTPTSTPTVFFGHDMIPERMGFELDDLWWRQKRRAIQYAAGHIMVSQSSANDMCEFHPGVAIDNVLVAHNSVTDVFRPCDDVEVRSFRQKHGINRPFVMLVGERFGWKGYKNGAVVFSALALMTPKSRPLLVCVGGQPELEEAGKAFLGDEDVRLLQLDDEDLRACYASALAYICPSSLEGFGLPIVEAMAVGCPALVCRNSSIPEVAGDAGIYFDPNDPGSLIAAIDSVRDERRRGPIIAAGRLQSAKFDQERTARQIADYCIATVANIRSGALRINAHALEDALIDAERRRAAEVAASDVRRAMFDLKRELASSTRGLATASQALIPASSVHHAAAPDPQHTSLMIAIERRLAVAYARLRSHDESDIRSGREGSASVHASGPGRDMSGAIDEMAATLVDSPLTLIRTEGLSELEGPYPESGISRLFRWQVEPVSRLVFASDHEGEAVLEIDFGNLEPEQGLRITVGDEVIDEIRLPEAGWDHEWHLVLPVSVSPGLVEVKVEAARGGSDNQSRYVAVYGVSLRLN